jgi:hypothetical protein
MFCFKVVFLLVVNYLIHVSNTYGNDKPELIYFNKGNIEKVTKYNIEIPSNLGMYTRGFVAGVGSGLSFKGLDSKGNLEFYVLTDRGPNIDAPNTIEGKTVKIFPQANFSPFIGMVTVNPSKSANLTSIIGLTNRSSPLNGLPLPLTNDSVDREIAIDSNLNLIPFNENGVDPESVDYDKDGNLWVGEEYGPSIVQINGKNGKVIKRIFPNEGLPEVLKYRQKNRGFESIAVTPNGKIYAAVEGTLDIKGETKDIARFIRIVEFDPKTDKTKMYAYPLDPKLYSSFKYPKLGDMAAIDNSHFLIIEQGPTKERGFHNSIYMIDISDATDITDMVLKNGKALEYGDMTDLIDITTVSKIKLFNMRDFSWDAEKMEGITIISDEMIAITNDNDFGVTYTINTEDQNLENYKLDIKNKSLIYTGGKVKPRIVSAPIPSNNHNSLWIIKLKKPLSKLIAK